MSTLGTSRTWVLAEDARWIGRREAVLFALLAAALFACFFAIGRAASPPVALGERAVGAGPVQLSASSIPLQLSGAPPIVIETPRVARPAQRSVTATGAPAVAISAAAPSTRPTVTLAPVSPPVVPVQAHPPAPSVVTPQLKPTRIVTPQLKPTPKPTEGGKSFDSSG